MARGNRSRWIIFLDGLPWLGDKSPSWITIFRHIVNMPCKKTESSSESDRKDDRLQNLHDVIFKNLDHASVHHRDSNKASKIARCSWPEAPKHPRYYPRCKSWFRSDQIVVVWWFSSYCTMRQLGVTSFEKQIGIWTSAVWVAYLCLENQTWDPDGQFGEYYLNKQQLMLSGCWHRGALFKKAIGSEHQWHGSCAVV